MAPLDPRLPEDATGQALSQALGQALGQALHGGGDVRAACRDVGAAAAGSGRSMEELLEELALVIASVAGRRPDHTETAAAAVGWAEATLGYLHRLTCEDPLTGLASLAHLQARVAEVYREADPVAPAGEQHALVVLEPARSPRGLGRALLLARLGGTARRVFPGGETVASAGGRVVVLAARPGLEVRLAALRELLRSEAVPPRLWVEGLPVGHPAASLLLDELARS